MVESTDVCGFDGDHPLSVKMSVWPHRLALSVSSANSSTPSHPLLPISPSNHTGTDSPD